ncbi:MAG: AAA family ATPase [Candidatus Latescibacterota bacterium]|nr:AAA family ATPase [Candidatus Latescibacterota bacterium]
MDLFDASMLERQNRDLPLAARMRPRSLETYVGQDHILGPGRLLRRAIQADQLSSLIFYGPPGTGKTTLASVIAESTQSHFISINAVLAGVNDIRGAIDQAQDRQKLHSQRTILFVDEVHRFNKAQQDALLPWVEDGMVILIGATTENPYFSVNRPLLSRSRVFQLKALQSADLMKIAHNALGAPHGYAYSNVRIEEEALEHLVNVANGDARALLNALELAVETTLPNNRGHVEIDLITAEESIQQRALLYDKEGDYHFDTISAFIKSMRGSDPDATLYWLARMVYAGEDPLFIFRRMLIFASEDIGLADSNALSIVQSAAQTFDRVGLPEGRFALSHAALYLATAPKSNSTMAFFDALNAVKEEKEDDVPSHLKDSNRDSEGFGHGKDYLYPHAFLDHWVAQQYLPENLKGRVFYQPSEQGAEEPISQQVLRRRELQLEAVFEEHQTTEILTNSPPDADRNEWLIRAAGQHSESLEALREKLLKHLRLQRHDVVLDINSGTGLLGWEIMRQTPEGGVWMHVKNSNRAKVLKEMAAHLSKIDRPVILCGPLSKLQEQIKEHVSSIRYNAICGRNVLSAESDKTAVVKTIADHIAPGGRIALSENLFFLAQRLYKLFDLKQKKMDLFNRVVEAEEAIYQKSANQDLVWNEDDLQSLFLRGGFRPVTVERHTQKYHRHISKKDIDTWFAPGTDAQPTYSYYLSKTLESEEITSLHGIFLKSLSKKNVIWTSNQALVFVKAGDK